MLKRNKAEGKTQKVQHKDALTDADEDRLGRPVRKGGSGGSDEPPRSRRRSAFFFFFFFVRWQNLERALVCVRKTAAIFPTKWVQPTSVLIGRCAVTVALPTNVRPHCTVKQLACEEICLVSFIHGVRSFVEESVPGEETC